MKFPIIRNIQDVLPHIEGFAIKQVTSTPGVIILNYVYSYSALFDTKDDPIGGMMRRECRGITFDANTGDILSRPYHKFFNLGEKEETLPANLPDLDGAYRLDKRDGSMVHPVPVGGEAKFFTRGGLSDVAKAAMSHYRKVRDGASDKFIQTFLANGFTPMFEWEDKNKTIVLKHPHSRLVLTGIRHNITGEYLHWHGKMNLGLVFDLPCIPSQFAGLEPIPLNTAFSIQDYMDMVLPMQGIEGEVLVLPHCDGFYKIKTNEYQSLHHAMTGDLKGRHILERFLEQTLDDFIPKLEPEVQEVVLAYEAEYVNLIEKLVDKFTAICHVLKEGNETKQKRFEYIAESLKDCHHFITACNRVAHYGKDAREQIREVLEKIIYADNNYAAFVDHYKLKAPTLLF